MYRGRPCGKPNPDKIDRSLTISRERQKKPNSLCSTCLAIRIASTATKITSIAIPIRAMGVLLATFIKADCLNFGSDCSATLVGSDFRVLFVSVVRPLAKNLARYGREGALDSKQQCRPLRGPIEHDGKE